MPSERVTLSIPCKPEYAKTVRMTAATLVSRTAMSYDEVDDVRIAAEEAFVYACDHSVDGETIDVRFSVDEAAFEIRVSLSELSRVSDEDVERRTAYATFILQSVCDHFEMSSDENGPYLRVVKAIPPTETADADI